MTRKKTPPPPRPRVFKPLEDQREGHCCFCGMRALDTICGFCRQELEGTRS